MVLAALAKVTDDRTVFVPWEVLGDALSDHALSVPKTRMLHALHSLRERDLVIEKRIGRSLQYGFKMDLIRLWLRQNDVLLRLTQEERP